MVARQMDKLALMSGVASDENLIKAMEQQWGAVPAAVIDHIQNSPDLKEDKPPRIESIGLSGAYEPVRTMVLADTLGLSRSGFEAIQGQVDFGFNREISPNWQRPRIVMGLAGGVNMVYDGQTSFDGCESVTFVNTGKVKEGSVLNLDSDSEMYDESTGRKRVGGYGQGLKIMLVESVATAQDKINLLTLMEDGKFRSKLADNNRYKIRQGIWQLMDDLKAENNNENSFSTFQSDDPETGPYRAYCYREPYKSN